MTALLYDRTMKDWRTHDGIDIAAELGAGHRRRQRHRNERPHRQPLWSDQEITHANGLVSTYSNLAELPTVQEGDGVMVGEVIAPWATRAICESCRGISSAFLYEKERQQRESGGLFASTVTKKENINRLTRGALSCIMLLACLGIWRHSSAG